VRLFFYYFERLFNENFISKSFMWITMGFTFGTFVLGGLSWWVPTFIDYAVYSYGEKPEQ
jgi:hypothetical protein